MQIIQGHKELAFSEISSTLVRWLCDPDEEPVPATFGLHEPESGLVPGWWYAPRSEGQTWSAIPLGRDGSILHENDDTGNCEPYDARQASEDARLAGFGMPFLVGPDGREEGR